MAFYGHCYRYVLLLVGFLCLTSVCSNYTIINFTFLCMAEDMSETRIENGTEKSIYDYSVQDQTWIHWALGAGTVIGTFCVNWLYVKYGGRIPFLIAGLVSLISTAFIPFAAKYSFFMLLVIRFLQGIAYSADFSIVGMIAIRWSPLDETTFFLAILTSFSPISGTITNSLSGFICKSSLGWRWAFYIHSMGGAVLFLFWALVYYDDPKETKWLSKKELLKIEKDKSANELDSKAKIPYKSLITSPVVLTIWLNAFFEICVVMLLGTYMPTYFHNVLRYEVAETGYYISSFLLLSNIIRVLYGLFIDKLTIFPEHLKIVISNLIAVGFCGISYGLIGFVPAESRFIALVLCFLTCSFCVFNVGGFYKCSAVHARQFAPAVIAAIQFMKCVALFVAPALVGMFVTDKSIRSQWIPVFLSLGCGSVVVSIASMFILTDKPAKWTNCEVGVVKYVK